MTTMGQHTRPTDWHLFGNYLEEKLNHSKEFLLITIALNNSLQVQDDLPHLDKLLAQRQECIDAIDKLDCQLGEIKDINFYDKLPAKDPMRARVQSISEKLKMVIQKSAELDKESMEVASLQLNDLRKEILKIRQGNDAFKSYNRKSGIKTRFLDIKE